MGHLGGRLWSRSELRCDKVDAVRQFVVRHGTSAACRGQILKDLVSVGGIDDRQRALTIGTDGKLIFWAECGSVRAFPDLWRCHLLAAIGIDDGHFLAIGIR